MKRHSTGNTSSIVKKFICEFCDFKTTRESNYMHHQKTPKHARNVGFASKPRESLDIHDAVCGDEFCPREEAEGDSTADHVTDTGIEIHHDGTDVFFNDYAGSNSVLVNNHNTNVNKVNVNISQGNDWFPFTSKLEMLLYILLHSKTHIMSDETARYVWYVMNECGIEMPAFSKIKNMTFGDLKPENFVQKEEDKDGMPFWMIKPSTLLQMNIAHPDTSNKLKRYPRTNLTHGIKKYAEQVDGGKYQDMTCHWACYGSKEFYAGDFVFDNVNRYGQIKSFCEDFECDSVYAVLDMYEKIVDPKNSFAHLNFEDKIPIEQLSIVDVTDNDFYIYDDENHNLMLMSDQQKEFVMAKSHFQKVERPVITVPVNLFIDDTSANPSRKWKPLHCIQMQASGLPNSSRQQHRNVKFIAASTNVSILQLIKPVVRDIQAINRDGVIGFDAKTKKEVTVSTGLSACICDFNMLSEAANHMGPNTKKFCPRCYADATTCTTKGTPRTVDETRKILRRLEINNNSKDMRQKYGLKAYENCLWDILNPHSDIPVGQLHWLYLGIAKHILKMCLSELSQIQLDKLSSLIESMDQSTFETPLRPDTIKYLDSRQGKDIKNYLQIVPFHMALVRLPVEKVKVLCKISELSKIFVLCKEYTEDYLEVIHQKMNALLQDFEVVFPGMLTKVKTHLSTHIVDDIRNHGPPKAYLEDGFEKMHGRIRAQISIQNQHAMSRDCALAFCEMEILQHIITGGFFKEKDEWVQAKENVTDLADKREIKAFLGWSSDAINEHTPGLRKATRTTTSKVEVTPLGLNDILLLQPVVPNINLEGGTKSYYKAISTQRTRETANENTPVLYIDNSNGQEEIGFFVKGLEVKSNGKVVQLAHIQMVEKEADCNVSGVVCESVHVIPHFKYVLSESVLQTVCLVHACNTGSCHFKEGMVSLRVEQEMKQVKKKYWLHADSNKSYYINKFSFVNHKDKYYA